MPQRIFRNPTAVSILDTCPTAHWRSDRIYTVVIRNTDGDQSTVKVCYPCSVDALAHEERKQS